MSNTTAAKASSFSVTCNLLSQFIKEKGRSFADLGIARSIEASMGKMDNSTYPIPTTMSLLPGVKASEIDPKKVLDQNPAKSMDLFPQIAGFGAKEDNKREQENKQLTIFYNGKVLVFDNFPEDKAADLMMLAGKGSAVAKGSLISLPPVTAPPNTSGAVSKIVFPNPSPPVQTMLPPRSVKTVTSDLPIARKASLHRFLEKRKDRVSARAPYQVNKAKDSPAENPWLGLSSECSK